MEELTTFNKSDFIYRRYAPVANSPGKIVLTDELPNLISPYGEGYTSHFAFTKDALDYFNSHKNKNGNPSMAKYPGPCYTERVFFDIDQPELLIAVSDCQKLLKYLTEGLRFEPFHIQIWFSGKKGFHVGIPTSPWGIEPSPDFNLKIKKIFLHIEKKSGVKIDKSLYDKIRLLRLPFSRHPVSHLNKIPLQTEAMLSGQITAVWILENAKHKN